ncbi:MAG TPA: hypothetical protein PLL20_09300 [Phycisphaerae bacterium]|nr:hypothetical protein [Phycisphaerae bacterium]HRR87117.1 hypothetical protein [Phycisphaerae bacterium]
MPNEADTCRRFVVPRLQAAGCDCEPHRLHEQVTFTDGRIIVTGRRGRRRPGKRADYILRYRPDMPIAVVEAKPTYAGPGDGLQQVAEYAEHGTAQFVIPDLLQLPPINRHGNVIEIARQFGGEEQLIEAIRQLQTLLYAA